MREIKYKLAIRDHFVGYEKWYGGAGERASACWLYSTDGEYWNPQPIVHDAKYQYAGLKDKNGQEIYEGDIVAIKEGQAWSVEFDDGGFSVFNQLNSMRHLHESMVYDKSYLDDDNVLHPIAVFTDDGTQEIVCEVIGNIYENPELLEGEK